VERHGTECTCRVDVGDADAGDFVPGVCVLVKEERGY